MKKVILNIVLIAVISFSAKAQMVIDSTSIVKTCLQCIDYGTTPLPNPYGSIYVAVSGGVSPYTFSLTGNLPANANPLITTSNTGITNFYDSLCQDSYELKITDDLGSSITYNFSTIPPTPPTLSIDSVSVKADSTNNPNSGLIKLYVTTNADSVFYLIQDANNTLNLGSIGGWQDSTVFDSLPGGYYYNVFVNIYPKVTPSCGNGIDTTISMFQIYVPLSCEGDGYASFAGNNSNCFGNSTNLTDESYPGSGVNNTIVDETWDFGDGNVMSGNGSVSHSYGSPGNYTVSLQITTSLGCSFNTSMSVNVDPCYPMAAFDYTQNGTGQFSFTDLSIMNSGGMNSGGFITDWNWDFGDGNSSSDKNSVHQYADTGSYTVCLTVISDFGYLDEICKDITYSSTAGIEKLNNKTVFNIYPNPTKNDFVIQLNEVPKRNHLVITNLVGETVYSSELHKPKTKIDLSNMPKGIYLIKLQIQKTTSYSKIIKL